MRHSEQPITPAQRALLDICAGADASELYRHLSTTLSTSIQNFNRHSLTDDLRSSPTEKTIEAWYFTLELMECLHAIALEGPPAG